MRCNRHADHGAVPGDRASNNARDSAGTSERRRIQFDVVSQYPGRSAEWSKHRRELPTRGATGWLVPLHYYCGSAAVEESRQKAGKRRAAVAAAYERGQRRLFFHQEACLNRVLALTFRTVKPA